MVVMAGKATLHELQTVYGLGDLYDLVEIIAVERHNDLVIDKHRQEEAQRFQT